MDFIRRYHIFIGVMLIFSVVTLSLFYSALNKRALPVYNPAMVNPELVDSTVQHIGRYHTVADFSLLNQDGKTVTQKDYEGKIYVADFFFTTCGSICPKMTALMKQLQERTAAMPDVMLLSHTVMPDVDDVPTLKKYADSIGADPARWNLVTGDKKQIYTLARKSYLAVKQGRPDELYDMVHTENFVLVDQKRRVRGFYDGTDPDELERLLEDIKLLRSDR